MKRIKSLVFAACMIPALALAQAQKSPDDFYKDGETQYNLGNFEAAAEAFKAGFAVETVDSKKPAYLYNIAQAYRQANRCKDAAFFYKRYLSLKDQDTAKPLKPEKRAEIEQRIKELEECATNQADIAKRPPDSTIPPGGGNDGKTGKPTGTGTGKTGPGTGTTGPGTGTATGHGTGTGPTVGTGGGEGEGVGEGEGEGEGDDGGSVSAFGPMLTPTTMTARFVLGGAKIKAGDLHVPIQPSFALYGGYPVFLKDKLEINVGGMFAFTPVPYENGITNTKQTGSFISLLANGAATYEVAPKIAVRGDLGLGFLAFTGIRQMGNPFTEGGAGTSGALGMFAVRVAASADYAITHNIVATVTPIAVSYSPAKSGLREDISAITRLDFMLGVGYRM